MIASSARWQAPLSTIGLLVGVLACGDATAPVTVTSVDVTSPIGSLLDVGGAPQLAAAAKDAQGAGVSGVTLTWTSTNPDAVTVSSGGRIEAVAVGTATIRADAGTASGSLAVRVVEADLGGITTLATDAFVTALLDATTADVRARLQTAATSCQTGVQQGFLEQIQGCVAAMRTEAANATDPTDRALLAVVGLFADQIERLLGL